jgi:acyl-CoA synthetase (AMP-forming)/AMP-acid ligase II
MEFNFADLFESIVDAAPDRLALVCGESRLTYGQLDARANRLAHHLVRSGIEPGEHIGVHMYNGPEYVECMLAAFKIRAVPVNINYRYVAHELRALFRDADLVALVHQREFGPRVAEVVADVPTLRHLITVDDSSGADGLDGAVDYEQALRDGSAARGFPQRSAGDLHIIYTGGTTGTPKGVMWRHEDLFFAGMAGGNPAGEPAARPEDVASGALQRGRMVMFSVPPLMHGAAQLGTFICFWGLGTAVLVRHFDPVAVWQVVEKEGVNTMSLVGDAMARPLAEALETGTTVDTSSLFAISSAGAIFSATVREQLSRHVPNVMLLDNFGASETGYQGSATADSSPDRGLVFRMNDRTEVLGDDMRPVTPGSGNVGRVALRGRVPVGYYNDPVKTARTFVEVDGERWAMLGDLATVNADGTVSVLGRGSECINTGGEKVFPEEVEAVLKSHPDVFDAIVVGLPDERWGERVCAVVAPRPGRAPELDALTRHCQTRLARYKLPRVLVTVPDVVRSPSGKPDYGWARSVATTATPAVSGAAAS